MNPQTPYGAFDPDEFRRMHELMEQIRKALNPPVIQELGRVAEQYRKAVDFSALRLLDQSVVADLSRVMNRNQETIRFISEAMATKPLITAAQWPKFNFDPLAFQSAAAALRPIVPRSFDIDRLERRAAQAETAEEAEDAVEEALQGLDPAVAAEFAAKLSATIASFLALLETVGYDTKTATALVAFVTALCWVWAHIEQHAK